MMKIGDHDGDSDGSKSDGNAHYDTLLLSLKTCLYYIE